MWLAVPRHQSRASPTLVLDGQLRQPREGAPLLRTQARGGSLTPQLRAGASAGRQRLAEGHGLSVVNNAQRRTMLAAAARFWTARSISASVKQAKPKRAAGGAFPVDVNAGPVSNNTPRSCEARAHCVIVRADRTRT